MGGGAGAAGGGGGGGTLGTSDEDELSDFLDIFRIFFELTFLKGILASFW